MNNTKYVREKRPLTRLLLPAFFALMLIVGIGCRNQPKPIEEENTCRDLQQIRDSGELVVLTLYSSTSYFIYRGQEMGFQYELSEQFARSLGVKLRVEVARNETELINKLLTGEGDMIAYPLPITKERRDSLTFCGEEVITHQVIVQRSGRNEKPLTDVTELIDKDVYVLPGKYHERLLNLDQELGGGIRIHVMDEDSLSIEDLITQVVKKEIDYTVADNDVARLNKTYHPGINIDLGISFDQRAAWAVRNDCPELAEAANLWHEENQTSPAYTASMKRYFEISKSVLVPHAPVLSVSQGLISPFDPLFRRYAREINWDWRLLASLAYKESNFDPEVVSWAGARGLMQLMPATARAMGVPEGKDFDPEESVKGAIRYLAATEKSLGMISDPNERLKFVLGAYNAGLGHIYDAMALAEKYGKNKFIWHDNVETFILLKSNEEYFTDPVCKNGYFRGTETYNFVREIIARYEIYKQKIRE